MTYQITPESKAPNARRDFVKSSVLGLLAGLCPTISVSAAHGSTRQIIQGRRRTYSDVVDFEKELRSNEGAFEAFKIELEQFHVGVSEGGDIHSLGMGLINSNETLRKVHQQNSGGNDPQAIIVVIIIIILILIPLTAN